MHGVLYFMLEEYRLLQDPALADIDYEAMMAMCETNLQNGIETYELLAMPSYSNITALLLGVRVAAEPRFEPL